MKVKERKQTKGRMETYLLSCVDVCDAIMRIDVAADQTEMRRLGTVHLTVINSAGDFTVVPGKVMQVVRTTRV